MKIMQYILAIVIGWIAGVVLSITFEPVANLADNAGLLVFWPVGIVMGHHSAVISALLVFSALQFPVVLFCGKRIPSRLRLVSVFVLLAGASFAGATNLIALGSQI